MSGVFHNTSGSSASGLNGTNSGNGSMGGPISALGAPTGNGGGHTYSNIYLG